MEALKRALLGCTDLQSVPGCCARGSCKELEAALGALGLGKGTLLPLPSPEQCFESGVSHWRAKKPGESSGILSPRWVFRRCCSCAPCKEPAKQDGAQLKGHCRDPSLLRSPPPQCCPGTARLHLEGSGGHRTPAATTARGTMGAQGGCRSSGQRGHTRWPLSRGSRGGKTDLRQAGPRCITLH